MPKMSYGIVYTGVGHFHHMQPFTPVHRQSLMDADTSTTVIEADEARHLPNRTMVLPGTEGKGIISLEVFHQLHCLVGNDPDARWLADSQY